MLSPTIATWRLVIHVIAATIWVGGQFTLAGAVPAIRGVSADAARAAARAYSKLAWPAFAVLFVTGIWNLFEVDLTDASSAYQATVLVKILLVGASGAGAAVHQVGTSKAALAVGGAVGGLGALAALFLGVLLRTGG